jgi:hypothetical protein
MVPHALLPSTTCRCGSLRLGIHLDAIGIVLEFHDAIHEPPLYEKAVRRFVVPRATLDASYRSSRQAVSNAGGLGSLPCAMLSRDAIRNELAAIKVQTGKPFNVNFFCHAPPALSSEREATWRAMLSPYYTEYGIDVDTISVGPGRPPSAPKPLHQ